MARSPADTGWTGWTGVTAFLLLAVEKDSPCFPRETLAHSTHGRTTETRKLNKYQFLILLSHV